MFLKAINEDEINNHGYVYSIIYENYLKLLNDKTELNPNNQISNLIMAIAMNRLLSMKFNKFAFKNNEKEIAKYFTDAKLFEITDKKIKNMDLDYEYLEINKNTINVSTKYIDSDIVLENQFDYSRLNYFIDLINDSIIDECNMEYYDFYKNQYLYLTFLYFDSIKYEGFTYKQVKVLDEYLDRLRIGIENNYLDAFIQNAKNRYYNLNPYGILCPIKEIGELDNYIDELNAHIFDKEHESLALEIISQIRKFQKELQRDDIPSYKRKDLLEDSDYLNLKEFFINLKEGKIDDEIIIKERKLENLLSDIENLISEIKRKRD